MTSAFLLGQYVVHNAQFAVMAAFTGAALLGIADFSGDRTERLRATFATAAVGAALLALGTAVSSSTAGATVTMFVVSFVVGYSAIFSGYFAAASSAVVVFYVVATGFPGPASAIPAREAGLAVGGGMSLVAIGWVWPSNVIGASRRALADVYRKLAEAVGCLSGEELGVVSRLCGELDDAILQAEQAMARSAWRPDGLAGPHKARLYLLQGARRMREVIGVVAESDRDPHTRLHAEAAQLEGHLAGALEACAVGIEGGPVPEPDPVERATDRFASAARTGFAERVADGASSETLRTGAADAFLLHQLGWGVVLAVLHTRAMYNAPVRLAGSAARARLVGALFDGPSFPKWVRRARRNFTPHSVHFQNSVRLASGLAVARLAVGLFDLSHGFWVGFATLVVLKTSAAGTRSTAVQAAAGTAIGFAVSSLFIAGFGVHDAVYAAVLPIVTFAAFYLPTAVSFVAGQAFFTMVIVVLFNLVKPAGWSVGLLRLEDVLIGAVIGLAIGMAIWPRGAGTELRRELGKLFAVGGTFARTTVTGLVRVGPGTDGDPTIEPGLVLHLQIAAFNVEDVFSQYLSEPHQSNAPVMGWAAVVDAAHRLWFGAAVASLVPRLPADERLTPAMADDIERAAGAVEGNYRQIAAALIDGSPLSFQSVPEMAVSTHVAQRNVSQTLTFLEAETWMGELVTDAEALGPVLTGLGVSRATDVGRMAPEAAPTP